MGVWAGGFRPYRGQWETIEYNTASAATFRQGCLVSFDGARNLIEATSASTFVVGIALNASVDSFPAGLVQVAVPRNFSATALATIQTGAAASITSRGQAYNIEKSANLLRVDTDSQASAMVEIVGPVTSANSTVEVRILTNKLAIPSYSSASIF